jgi:transcriptional regulator with XRE-family HTH domain
MKMLDLLLLHQPKDNKDPRAWILASGKNLRKQIDFLQSKLLQVMSKDELVNSLAEKADVKLKVKLNGLSVKQWLMQIKELRIKKGLGRHKMEKLTGTSGADWSSIERREHIPSCRKLRKILGIVNLGVEAVCDRDDFCLRSIDNIIKSFNSEWIPLVVISGLLELYKEKFDVKESQFNTIKNQIINSIDQLRVLQSNSKPIKAIKEINEDLAKIIGAFAADGNFDYPDRIRWEDEYKEQLEALSKWLEASFGIKLKIKPSKRGKNSFTAGFRNKIFSRYLEIFFGFYPIDKRYIVDEPKLIKEQSLKIRKAFAAGALMFDGSVNLDGSVRFSSISKGFRDSVAEILLKDGIKLSISKKPDNSKRFGKYGEWYFCSSRKLNQEQLKKLSFYFDKNTLKRKVIDFYLGVYKISNAEDLRILFPKIRSNVDPTSLFNIINRKRKGWDIYQLMNETNLSRRNLLVYLRILEVAGFLISIREGRKKIYVPTNISTNLCGS